MCIPGLDPVTLAVLAASTAASAGGAMINRREDEKNALNQQRARNDVLNQYLKRQDAFSAENQGYLKRSTDNYAPENQQKSRDENLATRTATINNTATAPDITEIPVSGSAPNVVKSEIASRISDAFRNATDMSKKAAKVGAYGDTLFGNAIDIGDTGRRIDTTNSFARAEAANLPSAQEFAGSAASKPRSGIGDIIAGLGQLGASAAGYGMFGAKPNVVPGIAAPRMGFASPLQRM